MLTREPYNIIRVAGVLNVGMGSKPSCVDWEKVRYYLDLSEKLRM